MDKYETILSFIFDQFFFEKYILTNVSKLWNLKFLQTFPKEKSISSQFPQIKSTYEEIHS